MYQVQSIIVYNRENNLEFWTGWDRLSNSVVALIKDDVVKAVYNIVDASNLASVDISASDFVSVSSTLLCCSSCMLLLPTHLHLIIIIPTILSYHFHCTLSLSNRPILLSKDTQPTIHLLSMVSRSTTLVDVQVGMNWVVQRILRFKSVQIVVMPMPLVFHLSIPRQEHSAASQQVVTTLALP